MLYKRSSKPGAHWWVRFSIKGTEVRQSSGTDSRDRAQAFERELRNAIWDEENLGIERHSWEDACERWLNEKAHKRSLERDRVAFRAFAEQLGNREVGDIGRDLIDGLRMAARDRAVLRSVLNACVRWGWLASVPKVEMPHEEKHDPRWITKEQFEKLVKELPPHAGALARFAVATGLRQRNVFRLQWASVDRKGKRARVGANESKSGVGISIPLSPDAMAILAGQSGVHPVYVFADHKGRAPITSIKTCWGKAVQRCGLGAFRFHDLRHTWAAWHTLAGTPPIILKELGGWASLAMVERYSSLNPGHLADWAGNSGIKRKGKK